MIGATLGRYRIVAKLGEGGMGSVWRAEDPALGRTVALKILSPALWASEAARQRFLREARAASQLDHPNIATVYDVGETGGVAWIAYQFIDGETVASRTANGPLPVAEAVALAIDTALALAHAHEHHVLHRDVTAGNVMVTREGRAVLVDFGLARPEGGTQLTSTGAMLGTAGYLAPEVLRGQPADERSDLYGLGAVLYRMVTGRLPFEGEVPEALLYRMLNEPVPQPSELRPELPAALERVVMKLLEREPADRFASAAEVEEALREVVPSRGPGRAERTRRGMARRWRQAGEAVRRVGRTRIGVAALAGVALLAAALWLAGQRGWLPGTAHGPQVLAVLPFENTSPDPEEVAYLAEGLGAELASRLGHGAGMRVIPWLTSRRQSDSTHSVQQLARELHADALLVGSFRAEGEQLRVTASLVDGRSGLQRWSQTFDQTLTDLLTVQTNLAIQVATQLQGSLAPAERAALNRQPTANPDAYRFYLEGVTYLQSDDYNTRMLAQPFFERALKLDSTLAEAYVGRGAALLDQHFRGTNGGVDALLAADDDFRSALRLDPSLVQAQRARIQTVEELGQPEEMLRIAAEVARRGDSDLEGLLTRGRACMWAGFSPAAVELFDKALTMDAGNQEAAWYRTVSLAWGDRFPECLEAGKAYVRKFGEDPELYFWMSISATVLGREAEQQAYLGRTLELFGDENSNIYSIPVAVRMTLERDSSGGRRLMDHWLPILRSRLEAAPDNYRVLGSLVSLEGYAGELPAMRAHLDRYCREIERRPAEADPFQLGPNLAGVAYTRDVDALARAIRAVRKADLMCMHPLLRQLFTRGLCGSRARQVLMSDPGYRALLSDVQRRVDALGRIYLPAVALRHRT